MSRHCDVHASESCVRQPVGILEAGAVRSTPVDHHRLWAPRSQWEPGSLKAGQAEVGETQ